MLQIVSSNLSFVFWPCLNKVLKNFLYCQFYQSFYYSFFSFVFFGLEFLSVRSPRPLGPQRMQRALLRRPRRYTHCISARSLGTWSEVSFFSITFHSFGCCLLSCRFLTPCICGDPLHLLYPGVSAASSLCWGWAWFSERASRVPPTPDASPFAAEGPERCRQGNVRWVTWAFDNGLRATWKRAKETGETNLNKIFNLITATYPKIAVTAVRVWAEEPWAQAHAGSDRPSSWRAATVSQRPCSTNPRFPFPALGEATPLQRNLNAGQRQSPWKRSLSS